MTTSEVYGMLASIDESVPVRYSHFLGTPQDPAPPPPWIVYFYPNSDDYYADNRNYQHISSLSVELYTNEKDFALEAKVEAALDAAGFAWAKEETYLSGERLYMVAYDMAAVITTAPAQAPAEREENHA